MIALILIGITLLGISAGYPVGMRRLRGYDWTARLQSPGLRRLGRLQDRAIQAIIGSIGAALVAGGLGIAAGWPSLLILVVASIFLGITMAATLGLVAIMVRIRRAHTARH